MENNHKKMFLGSEIKRASHAAAFQVLPVSFENSTSFSKGTVNGAKKIIEASHELEVYDIQTGMSTLNAGIFTRDEFYFNRVAYEARAKEIKESGQSLFNQSVEKLSDNDYLVEAFLQEIAYEVSEIQSDSVIPVMLGGEHTASIGPIKGLKSAMPDQRLGIVQFDAHADLRDQYGTDIIPSSVYSHACTASRILDLGAELYQVGLRAVSKEEHDTIKKKGINGVFAEEAVKRQLNALTLPRSFPKNVYITIDLDVFSHELFPATGCPVPGGLGWYQVLSMIKSIASQSNIVGFDIMEHSPIKGFHAYDFAAATLAYKVMGIIAARNKKIMV